MNHRRLSSILIVATMLGTVLPILSVSADSLNHHCIAAPKFHVKVENETSAVPGYPEPVPIVLSELAYGYCTTVTVEVWILGVKDMFAYEFSLNWSKFITAYWVITGYAVESVWSNQFVVLPDASYNFDKLGKASTISYKQAVSALPPSIGVSGDFKLATLKFHIYNDIWWWEQCLFAFRVTEAKVSDSCSTPILLCTPDDAVVDWGWHKIIDPPPFVSFDYLPSTPMLNETVVFNASASRSDYGDLSYQWNFGDGNITTTTDPIITHIYTSSGNYSVTLTVTDTENFSNSTTVKIEVLEPVHDVAATRIQLYRNIAFNSSSTSTEVIVENQGGTVETFNVTLYCHTICIGTRTVTLPSNQSAILTFNCTTPSLPGNYTLEATASQVPWEKDTEDNTCVYRTLQVSIWGDINADGKVDILDISLAAIAYQTSLADAKWNANADVNEDGTINILDASAIAKEYGKTA